MPPIQEEILVVTRLDRLTIKKYMNANLKDISDVSLNFRGYLSNYDSKKKGYFRAFLAVKQGFKCHYCKCNMTLQRGRGPKIQLQNFVTFEHLEDKFRPTGKNEDVSTVVAACYSCNKDRGHGRELHARAHYGAFFANPLTLHRFVASPKVGWKGIMREFGPLPD